MTLILNKSFTKRRGKEEIFDHFNAYMKRTNESDINDIMFITIIKIDVDS